MFSIQLESWGNREIVWNNHEGLYCKSAASQFNQHVVPSLHILELENPGSLFEIDVY